VKIRFTRDVGAHKAGEVIEISNDESSLLHWTKRGCLQVSDDEVEIPSKKEEKKVKLPSQKITRTRREPSKDIL